MRMKQFWQRFISKWEAFESPILNTETCEKSLKKTLPDQQTCFGYLDRKQASCEFDDGGPAVCDGVLQGIFSWDNRHITDIFGNDIYKCDRRIVGVFTRICYFIDWIQANKV